MSTQTDDPVSAVRTTVTVVPRVFAFLWEVSPALLVGLPLILAFNALAPAAMAWLSMKVIVNGVVDAATNATGWSPLAIPLTALFAVWVASAALTSLDGIVRRLLQEKTEVLESEKLLRKAGTLDIAFFETPRFYDLLHQAVAHRWRVHDVGNRSLTILRQAVSLLAMVSLLAVLHPIAILVLLASALPSLAMQGRFARQRNASLDEMVRGARIQEYLHELLTSRQSASEVRVFLLTDHLVTRFLEFAHAQVAVFWNRERRILTADILLDLLSLAGTAAIWVFAVVEAVGGRISVGDLTLVFCRHPAMQDSTGRPGGRHRRDLRRHSRGCEVLRFRRPRPGFRCGYAGASPTPCSTDSEAAGARLGAVRRPVLVSRVVQAGA